MNEVDVSENIIDTISQCFILGNNVEWEKISEGIRRKILGFDNNLMMTLVEFKKNAKGSVHNHPHRQVTYIIQGSFEVQIEKQNKSLKSGDSFFVPPSIKHGVVALEDSLLVEVFSPSREDFLKKYIV
jgi:quercetin dioxygenase-like cupin family protein